MLREAEDGRLGNSRGSVYVDSTPIRTVVQQPLGRNQQRFADGQESLRRRRSPSCLRPAIKSSRAFPGSHFGRRTALGNPERRDKSGAGERLRAPSHVKVLVALLVGERPPDLPAGDPEEVVDVEGPDPNTVARIRRGELRPVRAEGHLSIAASMPCRTSCCCARVRIEQPNRAVEARGGDARSVGAEGDIADAPGVPWSTATRDPLSTSQISARPFRPAVAIREPLGSKSNAHASLRSGERPRPAPSPRSSSDSSASPRPRWPPDDRRD